MGTDRIAEIDKLYEDVLSYRNKANFKELLNFIKKFPRIAPYNAMLLHIQKPGSVYVASPRDWATKFNRQIKPGARPLVILQPFGPVAFVYEYGDTEGEPLPDEIIRPFKTNKVLNEYYLEFLIEHIKNDGIAVEFADQGTHSAGSIEYLDRNRNLKKETLDGYYLIKSAHTIVCNDNLTVTEKYTTILHELGHLYCGHLYHDIEDMNWIPNRFSKGLSDYEKEFEAETVCWLIANRMGIETGSERYLAEYLDGEGKIPNVSVDAILKATGAIEALINGNKPIRKNLIIKKVKKQ